MKIKKGTEHLKSDAQRLKSSSLFYVAQDENETARTFASLVLWYTWKM